MVKVGIVSGTCARCNRTLVASRPESVAVCDCWEYCPRNHDSGAYGTKMEEYTPDLTPAAYSAIKVESGETWGDLDHPVNILRVCTVCGFHSSQKPVEVRLQ